MRIVAAIFFELGVVKGFMQVLIAKHFLIIFLFKKLCLIATVSNINRIV